MIYESAQDLDGGMLCRLPGSPVRRFVTRQGDRRIFV